MNTNSFRVSVRTAAVATAGVISLGLVACSDGEDTAPTITDAAPASAVEGASSGGTTGAASVGTVTPEELDLTAPGTQLAVEESANVLVQPWGVGDSAAPAYYWKITPHAFREVSSGEMSTMSGADTGDVDHWICMTFDAELTGVIAGEDPGVGTDSVVPELEPVTPDGERGNFLLYPNGDECGTPRDRMFPDRVADLTVGTVYQGVAAGYISKRETVELNPDGVAFRYSIRDDRFPDLEDAVPVVWR